ncbi:MAG TPA: hypothetical protein VFH68_07650 [Polyangia bacterium]|jgi:hypothetical protein|nr:hypothetical protein [Polyangia bacterium]
MSLQLRAAAIVLLSVLMLAIVGCVNRGQRPPGDGGGIAGAGGQDASPVDVVDGRPNGGDGSTACVAVDAGGPVDGGDAGDGGDAASATTCNSFMSFENCVVYGAQLPPPSSQLAFTGFSAVSAPTSCGGGALAIDAHLVPSDADTIHFGEIYLTIPGGPIDLGGKTLTFHAAASVPSTNLTSLYLIPVSSLVMYGPAAKVSPLKTAWTTASVNIEPGEIVKDSVKISIQLRGAAEYAGRIYIDEIEITNTPPDAGDAGGDLPPSDVRPTDVRDGGTGDATDARDGPG